MQGGTGQPRTGYRQLAAALAQQILSGALADGAKLTVRDLSARYRVNHLTVGRALQVLETQGLVQRVPRRGTFVTARLCKGRWASAATTILLIHMSAAGYPADPSNYYGLMVKGVTQTARLLGLGVQMRLVPNRVRVAMVDYQPPQPSQVAGVILCGIFDERYIDMYRSEGVPTVVLDCWTHDPWTDSIAVDVEGEAHTVIDYAVRLGHRTFGFGAAARREHNSSVRGFDPDVFRMLYNLRWAAHQRQVHMPDEYVLLSPAPGRACQAALANWLKCGARPSAMLCFDASFARLLLLEIERLGLRCPEDMSIISRGPRRLAGRLATRLVSDPEQMGQAAVRLLLERIRGQRSGASKLAISSRLVLGTTTGPAPVGTRQ